jgi:hypothetical protein
MKRRIDMKKHAVYLTVDELTDIIIAYDGSITLLKQNRRAMEFPHVKKLYTNSIRREQRMMEKLIKIRNSLQEIEREEI